MEISWIIFLAFVSQQTFCEETEKQTLDPKFCEGKDSISYHVFPDDCTRYIICMQDFMFEMDCPIHLHFNLKDKKCDWREHAGCEYIPTTPGPTTPTTTTTTEKPTPRPGTHCDPAICKLPACRCADRSIPGDLPKDEVPHMILIGIEDAVKASSYAIYKRFFNGKRKNPNGCTIKGTFFVSDLSTDYRYVSQLSNEGHEIAVHSDNFLSDTWRNKPYDFVEKLMVGQKDLLASKINVNVDKIVGWRSPLRIVSNAVLDVLANNSFLYDTSIQVSQNERWWPYTLDYPNPDYKEADQYSCPVTPCPKDPYPGLWEIPMNQLDVQEKISCPTINDCVKYTTENDADSVKRLFMRNYEDFRKDKIPFGIYGTPGFFDHSTWVWRQDGLIRFLDEVLQRDDVYIVTMQQAIAWMKQPTKLSDIKNFQPWTC